jgi:hypothetical protein
MTLARNGPFKALEIVTTLGWGLLVAALSLPASPASSCYFHTSHCRSLFELCPFSGLSSAPNGCLVHGVIRPDRASASVRSTDALARSQCHATHAQSARALPSLPCPSSSNPFIRLETLRSPTLPPAWFVVLVDQIPVSVGAPGTHCFPSSAPSPPSPRPRFCNDDRYGVWSGALTQYKRIAANHRTHAARPPSCVTSGGSTPPGRQGGAGDSDRVGEPWRFARS